MTSRRQTLRQQERPRRRGPREAAVAVGALAALSLGACAALPEGGGEVSGDRGERGLRQPAAAALAGPVTSGRTGAESRGGAGAEEAPMTATLDGTYRTDGARIVNGAGQEVLIRGINWFGFETAAAMPHGLWSRNLDEMLDQVAELGFNTLRLPLSAAMLDGDSSPDGLSAGANPDLVGLSSLELLDEVVARAGRRGLAVILDRHALAPDNRAPLWYDETYPADRLVADWTTLATRYADAPNVLGADLYNEPHANACWGCGDPARDWRAAAEEAAGAVLDAAPGWLVFVEGVEQVSGAGCDGATPGACTWWGGNLSAAGADPVTTPVAEKVVYSPHEYGTSVYRQPWFDDPSFPDNLPGLWDASWGYLVRDGVAPLMVGEFGSTLAAEEDRVWLRTLLDYLTEHRIGFTYWSLNPNSGDTGGILTDDWATPDQAKLDLLDATLPGPFPPVG